MRKRTKGVRSPTPDLRPKNKLLACLPRADYQRIRPKLRTVRTAAKQVFRRLNVTHDRVHREDFHLSHEFLAMMLGSTRPTVTIVAGALQKRGLIKYTHGRITILDRAGLEAASRECYGTVRAHFDRLDL